MLTPAQPAVGSEADMKRSSVLFIAVGLLLAWLAFVIPMAGPT
jgi:hypothetical protein